MGTYVWRCRVELILVIFLVFLLIVFFAACVFLRSSGRDLFRIALYLCLDETCTAILHLVVKGQRQSGCGEPASVGRDSLGCTEEDMQGQ